MVEPSEARWLLLIHQIPPQPNYLRVKVRRRLQQLGAVLIKQTVYALPRSTQAQEDFEWLRGEIELTQEVVPSRCTGESPCQGTLFAAAA